MRINCQLYADFATKQILVNYRFMKESMSNTNIILVQQEIK